MITQEEAIEFLDIFKNEPRRMSCAMVVSTENICRQRPCANMDKRQGQLVKRLQENVRKLTNMTRFNG